MNKVNERSFVGFVDDDEQIGLINIALVRHAIYGRKDGNEFCTLMFGDTHTVTFHGASAFAMVGRLAERAMALNGEVISSLEDIKAG